MLTQIPDARTFIALRVHYQLPLHVGIVGATEEAVGAGMCLEADSLRAVGREMIEVRVNRFRKGGIVVQVGDRVLIESEKVGDPARSGVVTWVSEHLIGIRSGDGSESWFAPSAGSLRVLGRAEEADAFRKS